jgi:hypothetical protein
MSKHAEAFAKRFGGERLPCDDEVRPFAFERTGFRNVDLERTCGPTFRPISGLLKKSSKDVR